MKGVSQRQRQVLRFIADSIHDRGFAPTLREIGAHMCICSTNGVQDHLRSLVRKGLIARGPAKRGRALVLTDAGRDVLDAEPLAGLETIVIHGQRWRRVDVALVLP